jgi:hypothetical protein
MVSLLALAACGETELAGLHVEVQADGAGKLAIKSLLPGSGPAPAEGAIASVEWTDRFNVFGSVGSFQDLSKVTFGGIRFATTPRDGATGSLRVVVPMGADAAWLAALAPDAEGRKRAARVQDPTGKTRELGRNVQLVVTAPGAIVASGVDPRPRGVAADKDGRRATLIVPADTARAIRGDLIWDVSWR